MFDKANKEYYYFIIIFTIPSVSFLFHFCHNEHRYPDSTCCIWTINEYVKMHRDITEIMFLLLPHVKLIDCIPKQFSKLIKLWKLHYMRFIL